MMLIGDIILILIIMVILYKPLYWVVNRLVGKAEHAWEDLGKSELEIVSTSVTITPKKKTCVDKTCKTEKKRRSING